MILAAILTVTLPSMTPPPKAQLDLRRLRNAIVLVEGNRWTRQGGAYGFTEATWSQYTRLPYRFASMQSHADFVAEKHLRWLIRSLKNDGVEPTVYAIAACWNFGLEGGQKEMAAGTVDYAVRVKNVYENGAVVDPIVSGGG